MPIGYRVTLGDGLLDPGDVLAGTSSFFTTDTVIGTGTATFFNATFNGSFFPAGVGSGSFILATDGYVYFDPSFDPDLLTAYSSTEVTTAPSFDGAIYGTSGNDALIAGTDADDLIYGGPDRNATGTGDDTIEAGAGDDSVFAGDGNDLVTGGSGADIIEGGAGNDTLSGDGGAAPTVTEFLDWTDEGGNGTNLAAGFTQTTGLLDVTVSFTNDGNNNPTFEVSTTPIYVAGGEPYDNNSSLDLFGQGDGATSTTTIEFSAATADTAEDEASNVRFRISDIDFAAGNHRDIVTVNAFDANGAVVPVTLTPGGADTVSGNTVTASDALENPDDLASSVLVEIAGPVQRIEISYSNGLTNTQAINVSDIFFDATAIEASNDSLIGGAGDDLITLGAGDTGLGGDGDDTFTLSSADLDGTTPITVVGGEGAEGVGDTLDFGGLLQTGSISYTNTDDDAGGLSGTATLTDGTTVTFSEIETIICFAKGTAIQTPQGERRIETLKPGDLVVTLDNGPQPIRWIGMKTVRGTGHFAPIRFEKGVIGNDRTLFVSPQHRMLCGGYLSQLHFGESEVLAPAHSLVDGFGVTVDYGGVITYVHMLFDAHEIVIANGAPSESFFPGGYGLDTLTDPARDEIFRLFPELRTNLGAYGPASRICLKPHEAQALVHA